MIEMTPEVKKQLLDLGRNSVDTSRTDIELLEKLILKSKEVITNKLGVKELLGCNVRYADTGNPELLLWATSLICMRWTLYLLKRKAIEGTDCRTHYKQTGEPCQKSKKFHDELFVEAKKSFKEIISEHNYEREVLSDLKTETQTKVN